MNAAAPEEARYAALRSFGNTTVIKEHTHEAWGWTPFEQHAGRIFATRCVNSRRSPAFAASRNAHASDLGSATADFFSRNVLLEPLAVFVARSVDAGWPLQDYSLP